jgi:hypothetical protein
VDSTEPIVAVLGGCCEIVILVAAAAVIVIEFEVTDVSSVMPSALA